MDSLAGGLFNLLGITGSGIATSDLAPPVVGPLMRERELAEFTAASAVQDPNIWSHYNTALSRPSTFDEMMRLWSDMSMWDMVTAALTELVEEASQPDPQTDRTIWYECSDKELEDDLNGSMLVNIDAESVLSSQLWHVAGFGNNFEKIHYERDKGVLGLAFAHPMEVRRLWLEKTRRCVGFKWVKGAPDRENLYVQGQSKIEPPTLNYGGNSMEDLWYPWDFLHMRRMFRMRTNEHGEPVFDEAQGVYKKLRMAIDQMTVHRAQVQPDRYLVNIDVQQQPPMEQVRTVQRWRQTLRSKLSFGEGSGTTALSNPSDMQSYYNAMSLDTILWMAKPQGFQHGIEKIAGTANVPDIYDIEILLNIFYSVIGMPKSWVGIGEPGANGPTSGRALLAQDMRFLRKVRALRKPVILSYTWLGYMHAMLRGKDTSTIDIKAKMSYIGTLEDELRMDVLSKQVDILAKMSDMLDSYHLDKDAWIDLVLRKYMHMPDDVINALRVALPPEIEPTGEGVKGPPKHRRGGRNQLTEGRMRLRRAFDEIKEWVESNYGKSFVENMHKHLNGDMKVSPRRFSMAELQRYQTLPPANESNARAYITESQHAAQHHGRIISSYDQLENAIPQVVRGTAAPIQENEPAYRRFIGK